MSTVLMTPSSMRDAPWLTYAIGQRAAQVIENVQTVSKKCRLDILFRAGMDRQELHAARLPLFVRDLDALYAAALMPRPYTLLGMVLCLCARVGIRPGYSELVDPGFAERLAIDLIHNKRRLHPMDRWLAIVCLGVLYEQSPVSISYLDQVLGPIESSTSLHPVQKVGLSFAWMDAAEKEKPLVIREKVLRLLDPLRWPAGLSQLPITVIGSYMGSAPEKLASALAREEGWLPIVYGLTSASYLANLGALAQLRHMPYHRPPSSVEAEVAAALGRLSTSRQALVREQVSAVPAAYRAGAA